MIDTHSKEAWWKIEIFGSYAKGKQKEAGDLDVIAEFEENRMLQDSLSNTEKDWVYSNKIKKIIKRKITPIFTITYIVL